MKNIIILSLLFCLYTATAQENTTFWNNKMLEIAYKGEHIGWVDIKEELNFSKNDFFDKNKEAFRLTVNDNMRYVSSTDKDELGYTQKNIATNIKKGCKK